MIDRVRTVARQLRRHPARVLLPVVLVTAAALAVPFARGQESAAPAAATLPSLDDNCLSPEEMAVVELVRRRHWELQQREEMVGVQEQAVRALQDDVREEVVRLEQLRDEIEILLEAREAARREGGDALVQMVNQMKPANAAEMLTRMEPMLASAVLERISPRQAGRILGNMPPEVAAILGASLALDPIERATEEGDES